MKFYDLVVVGGGPGGMMGAISAAMKGARVCLIERNDQLGKKLLMTGKGRCNFTSSQSIDEIIDAFGDKGRFLYSALTQFSNRRLIRFFKERNIKPKFERGDRVFAGDAGALKVRDVLENELLDLGVEIIYNARVKEIKKNDIFTINYNSEQEIKSRNVILATGGKSYPLTGSSGDGYQIAESFGHTITPLYPALNGLVVKNIQIRGLAGLSLKNIKLSFYVDEGKFIDIFGEMLFTHKGISGPIVLTVSDQVARQLDSNKTVKAEIDFKPALTENKLKKRIVREMQEIGQKEYQTLLTRLLPSSIIPLIIKRTEIDKHKKIGSLTREEQFKLVNELKHFTFMVNDYEGFDKAIVTSGGVTVDEIDSSTMESELVSNLYFAGEIIGVAGETGGYNLQKAFSTGWVAGKNSVNPD